MEIRYPGPKWLKCIGALLLLLIVIMVTWAMFIVPDNVGLKIGTVAGSLVGLLGAWVLLTAKIVVSVTSETAVFSFPPIWRTTLRLEEIRTVRLLERVSPAKFGGIGYRRVPGPTHALLWGAGPGVEVTDHDGRCFVVVTPEASKLADYIADGRPGLSGS